MPLLPRALYTNSSTATMTSFTTMPPPATGTTQPSATFTAVYPSDPCVTGSGSVPPQATIIAVGVLVPVLVISLLLGVVMYRSRRNRLPGQVLPTDGTFSSASGGRSSSRGFGGWLRSWTTRRGDSTAGGMSTGSGTWPGSGHRGKGLAEKPSFAASSMASRKDSHPGHNGTWYAP